MIQIHLLKGRQIALYYKSENGVKNMNVVEEKNFVLIQFSQSELLLFKKCQL